MMKYLFLGLLLGFIADRIWMERFIKTEKVKVFEHYHWSLVLAVLSIYMDLQGFTWGVALALLIAEHFQRHPYAYGSNHFKESTYIGLALTLIFVTVLITEIVMGLIKVWV